MSKRTTVLGFSIVGALMLMLPALASAGTWDFSNAAKKAPGAFSVSGGTTTMTTVNRTLHCTSVSGTGVYENETTGTLTLKFHGCSSVVSGFKVNCTTSGQPTGTVETTPLEFHNILIHSTTPGILITPNTATGVVAHFVCGGIASTTVTGNGIIGDLTQACGTTASSFDLDFESISAGNQKYTQITTTGTIYDLHSSTNGGAAETTSEDLSTTLTFAEKQTVTC